MNVAEAILAKGRDSAVAVLHRGQALTYAELRESVAGLAAGLLARGHRKGDRVGILSENSRFFVKAYLAVIRAGLVAVPLPTDVTAEGFARIVSDAGIHEVFVSHLLWSHTQAWAQQNRLTLVPERQEEAFRGDTSVRWPLIDAARDLAALMFTSGSTGAPKGVMVTHRNLECNSRDIITALDLKADDRVLVVLPFHYCFGLSLLHTHLMAGGSVVLNNEFRLFPESALTEMQHTECTGLAGVPSTYQMLLRNTRFRQMEFPALQRFQQAGGRLPNPCIQELVSTFPRVAFFLMYGQTEATARLSYLTPHRLADKLGSIGQGLASTRLEVLRPDGVPVRPGSEEIGEIVASGENITLGYWKDPDETGRYFRNGKLHTGDLGRVDADGFIFLVDREREIIKSGGNRVSAKEVEDAIAEMPEVVEVAVIGTPHSLLGEAVVAVVVPTFSGNLTPRAVEACCRRLLSASKIPQEVTFVPRLPHNSSGKVLKGKLKEMLARRSLTVSPHHKSPAEQQLAGVFEREAA